MYHKEAVKKYSLQVYASALLFSPADSLIRRMFQHEEPGGVTIKPDISNGWSACLQTLERHSRGVSSVAFSHDSTKLASASYDRTVKIWDAHSCACLQTLEGHSGKVSSVAFSHDSTRLASASDDRTVKIWDAYSGACLQTLEGYSREVSSADLVSILILQHSSVVLVKPHQPVSQRVAVSSDNIWVSDNIQHQLWLLTEYRPVCSAVLDRCISLGTGSGKVWLCSFT
jgi:WD40 repeat protein